MKWHVDVCKPCIERNLCVNDWNVRRQTSTICVDGGGFLSILIVLCVISCVDRTERRKSNGCRGKSIKGSSNNNINNNSSSSKRSNKQTNKRVKRPNAHTYFTIRKAKEKEKENKPKQNIGRNLEVVRLNLFCCWDFS